MVLDALRIGFVKKERQQANAKSLTIRSTNNTDKDTIIYNE